MLTAADVKQAARQAGADLVGIAPPERFADVPPERNPLAIFPDARSAIVLGRRITRGSLRGVEEGTHFNSFHMFGYHSLDSDFLALTTFGLVSFLEDQGWEAVPLFPYPPEAHPQGLPVRAGQPAPNVYPDLEHAAVAAGLGEIGYCRIFLSPEYGPRQRFQLVLTDLELEPDPLLEEPICGFCGACVAACPLGALDAESEERLVVAGRSFRVCGVDWAKCRSCQNGAVPNRYHPSGKPERTAALCVRTCLDALERNGRLSNQFAHEFRQREPWALDHFGQATTVDINSKATGCADPGGFRAQKGEV
jgi:ferredoxin